MKRALFLSALFLVSAFGTGKAVAHPLGNFSVNHLTQVEISRDRVDALYILDQAEIPTFQERGSIAQEPGPDRRARRGAVLLYGEHRDRRDGPGSEASERR